MARLLSPPRGFYFANELQLQAPGLHPIEHHVCYTNSTLPHHAHSTPHLHATLAHRFAAGSAVEGHTGTPAPWFPNDAYSDDETITRDEAGRCE